jgi:SEC-C motif
MNQKIGRNDPCHCGSGKKFKHCHDREIAVVVPILRGARNEAVPILLDWLRKNHRKATTLALDETLHDALVQVFEDDQVNTTAALNSLDEQDLQQIMLNLNELLIAQGDISVKGDFIEVAELAISNAGPRLSDVQRDWISQLASRPLRLYDVTDVVPGKGVTVCDAVETFLPPVNVVERSGSQSMRVGMQIGARIMRADDEWQFSGAMYPFSMMVGRATLNELLWQRKEGGYHPDDMDYHCATTIFEEWLAQFFMAPEMPLITDKYSGEPMLFISDTYRVIDKPAFKARLTSQPDVHSIDKSTWSRDLICNDGMTRPQASITFGKKKDALEVFYQTASHAEKGRLWLDALMGELVQFIDRTTLTPNEAIENARDEKPSNKKKPLSPKAEISPSAMTEVIEKFIRKNYANWADEPIPIFKNRTPRQEMQTVAGLERVKGLLRSYQEGEMEQADEQGRKPVSYQFLWDALRLDRI